MALSATPNVEIEFDAGVWTDVSALSRRATWRRGRAFELDAFSAGTAQVTLSNADRRFDPEHASGPYFGKLLPRKRIRIGFTYAGTTYWKFTGFVDGWPQAYDPPNDATTTVRATDGFKVLAKAALPSVWRIEVEADGPIAWYGLGESLGTTMVDTSGNRLHGVYNGGLTFNSRTSLVVGDGGHALEFSSTSNHVGYAQLPLSFNPGDVTFEAWFTSSTEGGSDNKTLLAIPGVVLIEQNWSSLSGAIQARVGQDTFNSTSTLVAGARYHLVVRRDGVEHTIWLNGTDVTTGAADIGADSFGNAGRIYVGAVDVNGTDGWDGIIDEVAVYDTALSDARIAAHYEAGTNPWAGDTPKERMDKVLDYIGWPAGDRDLDEGSAVLLPFTG